MLATYKYMKHPSIRLNQQILDTKVTHIRLDCLYFNGLAAYVRCRGTVIQLLFGSFGVNTYRSTIVADVRLIFEFSKTWTQVYSYG